MTATTISRFKKNCSEYIEQAVKYEEPVIVAMDNGNNAVILNEEYYQGLLATIELTSDPKFLAQLREAINEPLEECIDASEVEW